MLTNRYTYKELSRNESNGERFYQTPAGDLVPSVTTILSKTKSKEAKEGLEKWQKAVGPILSRDIVVEASSRGTRMHKYLEDYINTGVLATPGSNPYAKQANKMAEQIINNGLCFMNEIWGVEVSLYFPEIYAGTTDVVGLWRGQPAIIDFKQTNKPKKEEWIDGYYLQLCAYGEAHNEIYKTKIKKGVILMCSKDYEFQKFELSGKRWEFYRQKWWTHVEQHFIMTILDLSSQHKL